MQYPIQALASAQITGDPAGKTKPANHSARRTLNNGPAPATMILSSAQIFGNLARFTSALPSMMSIGASWGSATKPPNGSDPSEYWMPLIVFFQSGLPNQTPNFSM